MSRGDIKSASTSRKYDAQFYSAAARTVPYRCASEIIRSSNGCREDIDGLSEALRSVYLDPAKSNRVHGRDAKILDKNQRVVTDHFTDDIIAQILNNDTLRKVDALSTAGMKPCCKSTFESLTVTSAGELCRETLQSNEAWKKARELRISGSRIYGIYTYTRNKLPDWKNKSMKFFWPNEFTNRYVRHGIAHEQLARETYEIEMNVNVVQYGFIVHPDHRWIGYSPDGLVFGNREPEKLIEIKCVYNGKTKPITECLSSCAFLDKSGGIKKKHTYYGQIQLGMLLCNVKICDFVLFASFDRSIYVISIPFDERFALEMFTVVRKAYIKEMLHFVCLHKNQEKVRK